jgi:hypothetical protein
LAASDADAVASRRMLRLVVQRMAEAANAGEQKQAAGKKAVDEINAMFAEMTFEVTYPIRGVKRQAEGFRLLLGAPVGMDTVGGLSNNASYMLLKLPEADSPAPKPGDRLTIHGKARCLSTSFSDKEELAATGRYIRPILLETACGAVVVGIADSTFAVEAKTPPPAEP